MTDLLSPLRQETRPELSVGFVLSPDFTLTPLAGFVDALRLAADRGDDSRQIHCGWSFLGPEMKPCRASCGLEVMPTAVYGDPGEYDYIVVVGGLLREHHRHSPRTLDYLRGAAHARVPLVGLCTGGFVLAEAGLLENRRCCVHFGVQRAFVDRFPNSIPVTDANFVIDGGIITCPGSIAAIDVAAYLINRHCSEARAKKALSYLLVEAGRPRLLLPERPYDDKIVNADRVTIDAVRIMEMNIDRPFSVVRVAEMVNTTPQKLSRSFREFLEAPPSAFWLQMRLWHARHLLVNTRKSITEIAYGTGFTDAAHFCKTFRRSFNTTPQNYRNKSNQ